MPDPVGRDAPPPNDVMAWVRETYTDEGVAIWLRNWQAADDERRAFLARLARTPDGGT